MRDRFSQPNTLRCPTKPYRLVITTGMAKNVDLHSLCECRRGTFRSDNLPGPLSKTCDNTEPRMPTWALTKPYCMIALRANKSRGPALLCGIGSVRIAHGETPERLFKSHVNPLL